MTDRTFNASITVNCPSNNYRGQPRVYRTEEAADHAFDEAVADQVWADKRGYGIRYWDVTMHVDGKEVRRAESIAPEDIEDFYGSGVYYVEL